jgi:hypothetical protein
VQEVEVVPVKSLQLLATDSVVEAEVVELTMKDSLMLEN